MRWLLLPTDAYSLIFFISAAFNISLELQGGNCSDQLTLICRHSDVITPPEWIHNGTHENGDVLITAFPDGAVYTVQSTTEHTVAISGVGSVRVLDGFDIQCVYSVLGTLIKSNRVHYSFIPPGQCAVQSVTCGTIETNVSNMTIASDHSPVHTLCVKVCSYRGLHPPCNVMYMYIYVWHSVHVQLYVPQWCSADS